jgi:hypothetical protein
MRSSICPKEVPQAFVKLSSTSIAFDWRTRDAGTFTNHSAAIAARADDPRASKAGGSVSPTRTRKAITTPRPFATCGEGRLMARVLLCSQIAEEQVSIKCTDQTKKELDISEQKANIIAMGKARRKG